MIFVDNRGPGEAEIAQILKVKYHLDVKVQHVESGDFVFGDAVIERKTINDLMGSVTGSRHFWNQLKVMKDTYKRVLLIIEGQINFKDRWLAGIIYSIVLGWGIPYLNSSCLNESAEMIKNLFLKYGPSKTSNPPPPAVKKWENLEKIRWEMFQCIPGIGPTTAKRVYSYFPNFGGSCYNPQFVGETLKEIKGLSKKSKTFLFSLLTGCPLEQYLNKSD